MSAASVVLAPVVICDSSSEDEDTDIVPYNWQETRPVQYQVLDVFGDNDVQSNDKKTSESIVIEDDEDKVLVVREQKTLSEKENSGTIDLTEDNDVTLNGNHTTADDVITNNVKHKTSPTLAQYVKQVNNALQKNGVTGGVRVNQVSRTGDVQNGCLTVQDITQGTDIATSSMVSQGPIISHGEPVVLNDDLIVTGESKIVHNAQQKDVVVYGTMTGGVLEGCHGGEPTQGNEAGPSQQHYSYGTELSRYNDGDGTLIDQGPRPVSDDQGPRPVSEPIMNLVYRDNVRWFMTPEDREIVPRWSSIQNGDMVLPLGAPHDDNDTVDDTPVQYTTIEDILPPPATKTTKQQKSVKKPAQTKQNMCSKDIMVQVQKHVKHNNKTKPSTKQCLKKAEKSKQTQKPKTSKKAGSSIQKAAARDRSRKGLNPETHSHRTKNGLDAYSLPPCSVHVCYGMVYHGTRVECPRIVTPLSHHNRRQSQDRPKHSVSKLLNQKHKVSPKCANHRDLEPGRGGGREALGRRRFSRAAKTRQTVT